MVSLYYGYYEHISGAENLALFIAWFAFFGSLFILNDTVRNKVKEIGFTVPAWLDTGLDILATAIFVWNGAVITGIAYLIHIILIINLRDEVKSSKMAET